mmetsp:Transcript_38590/g.107218  ORF Transcript_38590/g.107218 Transcript_38590/m.107218 type:complete len:399 (-) Transcript_38590:268-1464(-)
MPRPKRMWTPRWRLSSSALSRRASRRRPRRQTRRRHARTRHRRQRPRRPRAGAKIAMLAKGKVRGLQLRRAAPDMTAMRQRASRPPRERGVMRPMLARIRPAMAMSSRVSTLLACSRKARRRTRPPRIPQRIPRRRSSRSCRRRRLLARRRRRWPGPMTPRTSRAARATRQPLQRPLPQARRSLGQTPRGEPTAPRPLTMLPAPRLAHATRRRLRRTRRPWGTRRQVMRPGRSRRRTMQARRPATCRRPKMRWKLRRSPGPQTAPRRRKYRRSRHRRAATAPHAATATARARRPPRGRAWRRPWRPRRRRTRFSAWQARRRRRPTRSPRRGARASATTARRSRRGREWTWTAPRTADSGRPRSALEAPRMHVQIRSPAAEGRAAGHGLERPPSARVVL